MFPSHMSVNDLGVFAVVMVFGLLIVLLFMFDFVSMTIIPLLCRTACVLIYFLNSDKYTISLRIYLLCCEGCACKLVYSRGENLVIISFK